uniref:trypsin n=1 Tax=Kryptolebias marmoratus TaxID=37003 RepID=A0A3Q2ZTQ9_KRYMA
MLKNSRLAVLMILLTLPGQIHAGRVIGGHEAKKHSRPYMVLLEMHNLGGTKTFCGGFLLNENFMMTAAHCQANYSVKLGLHNKQDHIDDTISVQKAFPHTEYDSATYNNDIMLLKLSPKVNINDNVKPIALADHDTEFLPQNCSVSGWGETNWTTKLLPSKLMEINVTLKDDVLCKNAKSYCSVGNTGPGQGDSGGPLVCEDGRAFGVVSSFFRINDTAKFRYTKIPDFQDWIKSTMKKALKMNQ